MYAFLYVILESQTGYGRYLHLYQTSEMAAIFIWIFTTRECNMTFIDPILPTNRVLTIEQKRSIIGWFCDGFTRESATEWRRDGTFRVGESGDTATFFVESDDRTIEFYVFTPHTEDDVVVAEYVDGCDRPHDYETDYTRLADRGDVYTSLEKDLLELMACLCDLSVDDGELTEYVRGDPRFRSRTCYDGTVEYALTCEIPESTVRHYRDHESEIVDRVWSLDDSNANVPIGDESAS